MLAIMSLPSMIGLCAFIGLAWLLAYLWDRRKEKKQETKEQETLEAYKESLRVMVEGIIDKKFEEVGKSKGADIIGENDKITKIR